ncbi:MAG: hypothetical protein IPG89_06940 [Bacteroidetes bacterium]|nr:hypothetical protein [Bacteroidota bacterium]
MLFAAIIFILTVIISILFLYKASNSKTLLTTLIIWSITQSLIAYSGFYLLTDTIPPRFLLMVGPPLLAIILILTTKNGKRFVSSFDLKTLTLLHTVRIPVELVLYSLFLQKLVPELMTFSGRNWDILSGISAVLIYFLVIKKDKINTSLALAWNFIGLGLLLNIVINAILSAPFAFQQFSFEQPNIGVLMFPYNLLPAVIVPIVLFSHLISIKQLLAMKKQIQ